VNEGIALLHQQGIQEEDAELIKAVNRCEGHASALIYLADMVKKRELKLANFLNDPSHEELWLGDIASNLLGYLYTRLLTDTQRKLLQTFSIYREAVPLKAVQIVMNTSHGQAHDLNVLYNQQLLNASGGHYQPTAIVAAYIRDHFDESNMTPQTAHVSAAQYYVQLLEESHTSSVQKKVIDKISLLAEAVWHYCKAEHWHAAYNLMEQNGFFADFKGSGKTIGLLEAYQLLLPSEKWQSTSLQKAHILYNLGMICADLGQKQDAQIHYEDALSIWNDKGETKWKGETLSNLGRVYSALGKKKEALYKYEEALEILQDTRDGIWIGITLSYLGRVYGSLEQYTQAKDAYERALDILKAENDRSIESITFGYLGVIYCLLGQKEKGLKYCQHGIEIAKDAKNMRAEGRGFNNLGRFYSIQGNYEQAKIHYEKALRISREARDRSGEGVVLQNMGDVCNTQGEKDQARVYYEKALSILTEVGDRWRESMVFNNLGNICASTEQWELAAKNYRSALNICKAIDDRSGEALTLYNIGKLFLSQKSHDIGLAYLMLAGRIFNEMQSSCFKEIEDQINGLRTILGEEQFKMVSAKVEQQQLPL
jgi:tetratricopeptide (TPR) repeat protein